MSVQQVEAILRWSVEHRVEDVNFLGGEPTLHPQFLEILHLAQSVGIRSIRFTTNGNKRFQALLNDPVVKYVNFIYLSLDGATEESHDAIRGKGSFNDCIKSLQLLQRIKIPFGITHTVTAESAKNIDALIKLAETSGCSVLNVHWLSSTGRAVMSPLSLRPEKWIDVCNHLVGYKSRSSDFTIQIQPAYFEEIKPLSATPLKQLSKCAVKEIGNLQFMPDGRVFICGLLVDSYNLHAFEWDGTELHLRNGETEYKICTSFTGVGCPIRQSLPNSEPVQEGFIPICIYERLYSTV